MTLTSLVEEYLATHYTYHPIDATFAGAEGFDDLLPPAHAGVEAEERRALVELQKKLDATPVTETFDRIDERQMRAQIAVALDSLAHASRFHNPAWYTGEAAFALVSLLLPSAPASGERAFARRLAKLPDFFSAGLRHLHDVAVPRDWNQRAQREANAVVVLLQEGLAHHPFRAVASDGAVDAACAAARDFSAAIAPLPDANPASGRDRLAFLMQMMHGLPESPEDLEARAVRAYDRAIEELHERARNLDPAASWRDILKRMAATVEPDGDDYLGPYERWHRRAMEKATPLVTPASEYALRFELFPGWTRTAAEGLYFLQYRSPPALRPGDGSVYWVPEARQNLAAIKMIHAVHHGSIGHHTQNARARAARSRIARVAGTDCASGLMFYTAGTLVEGWACYAEDLIANDPDFYTPAEVFQLRYFEFRNIACCLADIRLHTGTWTLEQMREFYRDAVGFAPERIWNETTRNSMFPATRLMYWSGSERIAALRMRFGGDASKFHDRLLQYGAIPVTWIEEEMTRCNG